MRIYRNKYASGKRYFFFINDRCIEVENCLGRYRVHEGFHSLCNIIKEKDCFPIVGEIKMEELIDFVLSKIKE